MMANDPRYCGSQTLSALFPDITLTCKLPAYHSERWHRDGDTEWARSPMTPAEFARETKRRPGDWRPRPVLLDSEGRPVTKPKTPVTLAGEARQQLKAGMAQHRKPQISDPPVFVAEAGLLTSGTLSRSQTTHTAQTFASLNLFLGFASGVGRAISWLTFRRAAGISIFLILIMSITVLPSLLSGYSVAYSIAMGLGCIAIAGAIVGLIILAMYLISPQLFRSDTKEK